MTIEVDNIIIGAGPGGYELAATLVSRGESVVIAERNYPGGTCLNRGCIPTKSLYASASAINELGSCKELGIETQGYRVDYSRVRERMEHVVSELREGVERHLANCTLELAEASFVASDSVRIGDKVYKAKRIVVASGSSPVIPDIPGKEYTITSDEALWLDHIPESLVIIGGGVIGMEFASIFSSFGSKVTVIEFCKEILPTLDSEAAKRLRTTMSRQGIEIFTGAKVTSISKDGNKLRVSYEGKKGMAEVEAATVVMAVGRRPVVPAGFTECGGRLTSRGFIETDSMMKTSIRGVYAIGDVNGRSMLAHSAYAQGRVVADADSNLFNADCIPSVVFTFPELASVGLTKEACQERGEEIYVIKRPFASNGKACSDGHTDGFVKMVCRASDDAILGITIIGRHAAELIAEATILVTDKIKVGDVGKRYVHAHPTLSEIFV